MARRLSSHFDAPKVIGKPIAEMGRLGPRAPQVKLAMIRLSAEGFSLPRPWKASLTEYIDRFYR